MAESKCPYSKCDGSGLLPFKREDGSVSSHCKIFCDCHPIYGVDAHTPVPLATQGNRPGTGSRTYKQQRGRLHLYQDDWDFSMSYDFYRMLCQEHGWDDPGSDYLSEPPKPEPQVTEVIHRHSDMSHKDFTELQNLRGQMKYLQSKIEELQRKRKPKPQVQPKTNATVIGVNL